MDLTTSLQYLNIVLFSYSLSVRRKLSYKVYHAAVNDKEFLDLTEYGLSLSVASMG